jgi:hypothetical protein
LSEGDAWDRGLTFEVEAEYSLSPLSDNRERVQRVRRGAIARFRTNTSTNPVQNFLRDVELLEVGIVQVVGFEI